MVSLAQVSLPFSFKRYNTRDGLLSNEINSIVQDTEGYIWIASNRGLQRFDGYHYKTFTHQPDRPGTLPGYAVKQIMMDRAANLWVLTQDGKVGIFDRHRFLFHPMRVEKDTLVSRFDSKLIADAHNNIFLLLRGGPLYYFNKAKKAFSPRYNFIPLPKEWGITSITLQPGTKKYWLGLEDKGIAIYNHETGNLSYYGHNAENEPAIELFNNDISLSHALFDKKGRLWFERWGEGFPYCVLYDPGNKERPVQQFDFMSRLKMYNEIYGFLQQDNGRIWVRGLQVFGYFDEHAGTFKLINKNNTEQGLYFQIINCLYEDREQNIWIATNTNGLYRFNPSQQYFTNVQHIHPVTKEKGEGSVMSFIELVNGDILASAWGDGLVRYDKNFNVRPLQIKNFQRFGITSIWNMHQSKDKNIIWMACQPGIIRYNQATGDAVFYNPPRLQYKTVRQLYEDKKGHLWIGMHNHGLFRWDPAKGSREFNDGLTEIKALKGQLINQLSGDEQGLIWATTGKNGLFAIEAANGNVRWHFGQNEQEPFKIHSNGVTAVMTYSDSLVAFSTHTHIYLFNLRTKQLRVLVTPDRLSGNLVSLARDDEGYIWAGTTNALYRISQHNAAIVSFDREDGITNDRFVISATYKLRDGRLLFGSSNEFIAFDPAAIRTKHQVPRVSITDFKVSDQSLDVDSIFKLEKLVLRPHENAIQVGFSPLTFANVYPVRYKLENFDKDWQVADREMKVSYSYLPPGSYTLMLQALDAEGKMSGEMVRIAILSKAPFYQTWWFYAFVIIAIVLVLYWFDRQRMKRKSVLQQVRINIANGLQEDVNTSLNNINILSEIARIKSDKDPVKAKEYLEQIHVQSHNMITALDDMLWSLNPGNDAMDKTINRIREYIDSLMQRYGVHIELMIDQEIEKLQLDMRLRHEAFLLFKEGIKSLVEAGTTHCLVQMDCEKNKLHFNIEFENKDCDMQQLNNLLHRHDMESRLHNLGAKLDVHVYKSRSMIQIQLPLV